MSTLLLGGSGERGVGGEGLFSASLTAGVQPLEPEGPYMGTALGGSEKPEWVPGVPILGGQQVFCHEGFSGHVTLGVLELLSDERACGQGAWTEATQAAWSVSSSLDADVCVWGAGADLGEVLFWVSREHRAVVILLVGLCPRGPHPSTGATWGLGVCFATRAQAQARLHSCLPHTPWAGKQPARGV